MSQSVSPFAAMIPPSAEVRQRLAVVSTEAALLRKLLQMAVRREKEAARLATYGSVAAEAVHAR